MSYGFFLIVPTALYCTLDKESVLIVSYKCFREQILTGYYTSLKHVEGKQLQVVVFWECFCPLIGKDCAEFVF